MTRGDIINRIRLVRVKDYYLGDIQAIEITVPAKPQSWLSRLLARLFRQ
jgi:hypothetical protein